MKIYVISDIHGHYYTFLQLLNRIMILNKKDKFNLEVFLVGDLIDRGRYSFQIVEFVKNQEDKTNPKFNHNFPVIKTVKGNHEELFIDAVDSLLKGYTLRNYSGYFSYNVGGFYTMLSGYFKKGINLHKNSYDASDFNLPVLIEHYEWMKKLPLFIETDYSADNRQLFISHSSVSMVYHLKKSVNIKDKDLFEQTVLWNRDTTCDVKNIYNVYGHTPKIYPLITDCLANIDRGVYKDEFKEPGFQELTALEFFSKKLLVQKALKKDRV